MMAGKLPDQETCFLVDLVVLSQEFQGGLDDGILGHPQGVEVKASLIEEVDLGFIQLKGVLLVVVSSMMR